MKHPNRAIWSLGFAFLPALVPLPSYGRDTDYSGTIEEMTTFIQKQMAENEVTGLSIALVDGQDVVWKERFGYADEECGVEATAETIYEIGAISKTMTATAIMQLSEAGLIDIDGPVTKYLPQSSIQPPSGFDSELRNPMTSRTRLQV